MELLHRLDCGLLVWIHTALRSPLLDRLAIAIHDGDRFLIPLGLIWLYLLVRGSGRVRMLAALLLVTLGATDLFVNLALKPWIDRVRPCFAVEGVAALVRQYHSPSFPSSHAANAFGAAVLVVRWAGRRWLWLLLVAGVIAISRVYTGVHYPSDAAAGALIGGGMGWAIAWLGEWVVRRRRASAGSDPPEGSSIP
ncbi:MAG: phosphatase PAP2 family protein [Candidatus Eisenbacteria bacterium]